MSLTDRQRKIVNPYADSLLTEVRAGAGYDYEDKRNRFVLDAIHEKYIYFFQFPNVGAALNVDNIAGIEDTTITEDDLMAYFALYPQNGKLVSGEVVELSVEEAEQQLGLIIEQLSQNNVLGKYISKTSELSYQESYEDRQDLANLIAIPPSHSNSYRKNLREAFSLPKDQYSSEANLSGIDLSPRASTYVITDSNVDLYDWRNNCLPGEDQKTYYNAIDKKYYFTTRTNEVELFPGYLTNFLRNTEDSAAEWRNLSEEAKGQYRGAVQRGIEEVLLATGKNSRENLNKLNQRFLPPRSFVLYTSLDTRPGSRWTIAVKIPADAVNSLPNPRGSAPSREETELSSLSKAKRIIGRSNKSASSVRFQTEDMIRYIFYGKKLIRQYDKNLYDLGLRPDMLNSIDLSKEAGRLTGFFDLLEEFYNYNKISPQDTDHVEMFFSDAYTLEYAVINGSFYYQGTGTTNFLNEEESPRVLNAFSVLTPTTFSIIKNSKEIYNEAKIASPNNRMDVLRFMVKYLFPTINTEDIMASQAARQEIEKRKNQKRKKLFETYKRVTQGDPRDFEFLYSNRPLKYTLTSTLNNMGCDTAQAMAVNQALMFWQNVTGKTRLQSVIRQIIIVLRDEIVQEEAFKLNLTQADRWAANPGREMREIERRVHGQIFCSLDVLGDFIEDQFLDPLGLPPEASRLVKQTINGTPKIEFKKCSMTSLKASQSAIYQKMLESILMNFLKSILAGIAKDFLKAILGCGPESPNTDLKNSLKKEDYGFVNLMDFLDDVDIVAIADLVGLKKPTPGGDVEVSLQEMTDFIEDVSTMSTPIEIQQLLNGDASRDLLEHIIETTTGTQNIVRSSIRVDDYNTINFTIDNISNFFFAIGEALDGRFGDLGEMGLTSPFEAYCDSKDGFVNPLTLQFPGVEIEAQYGDIVNSKIEKINSYCNMLRDLSNIEAEIERLISQLPGLQWYDDLLREISLASNRLFEWLAKFIPKIGAEPQISREQPDYNLYSSKMGTELFYQIFFSLREVLINQLYFSNSGTYFQTPAGFSYNRLGYEATLSDDFFGQDDQVVAGNFGGRRNAYTRQNVYRYIWSDPRTGAVIAPSRLNLPQYRNPIVPPYDHLDAAYYSIRNSPEGLRNTLGGLLSPSQLQKINYGEPREEDNFIEMLRDLGRDDNQEISYLTRVSNKVYNYLQRVEILNPSGWTGATYLRCSPSDRGNIQIFYNSQPTGKLDIVSKYAPTTMYNEVSHTSSEAPVGVRGDYDVVDYRIFEGTEFSGSQISVDNNYRLVIDEVDMPSLDSGATISLYSNLSIGITDALGQVGAEDGVWHRYEPSLSMQNYTQRIDTLINNSVVNDIGRRRMPRYVAALNKTSLHKTDDVCVTTEDIVRADAAIRKIQSNMFSFFVNIMPMASAYPNWRSSGTVKMISDYLTEKLIDDMQKKEILGSFYELVPYVRLVYPHIEGDKEFNKNPVILDSLTPRQNTKNIVEAVYIGILGNIAKGSEYSSVNKSVFDPTTQLARYKKLLYQFYKTIADGRQVEFNTYLPSGVRDDDAAVESSSLKMHTLFNDEEESPTDLGMVVGAYYFPVAFQIASYMIYMDKGIKFSERYSEMNYRILLEEAGADDSLLTALKGQLVQRFTPSFQGFPTLSPNYLQIGRNISDAGFQQRNDQITLDISKNLNARGYRFDPINFDIKYYRSDEVENRIRQLDNILQLDTYEAFAYDIADFNELEDNILVMKSALRRGYNELRGNRNETLVTYGNRETLYSIGGEEITTANLPTFEEGELVEIVNLAIQVFSDEDYRYTHAVGQTALPEFDLYTDSRNNEGETHKDRGLRILQIMSQRMRAGQTPLLDLVDIPASVTGYSRIDYFMASLFLRTGYGGELFESNAKVGLLEEKNTLEKLINRNE